MTFTNVQKLCDDPEDCPVCGEAGFAYTCDELLEAGEGTGYVTSCEAHLEESFHEVIEALLEARGS